MKIFRSFEILVISTVLMLWVNYSKADNQNAPPLTGFDQTEAFNGDRLRAQAWNESKVYLKRAVTLDREGYDAELQGNLDRAFDLYTQASNATSYAIIAYGKRGFKSESLPSDINYLDGVTQLDLARVEIVMGYQPKQKVGDILSGGPQGLISTSLSSLRKALQSAQIDQSVLPNEKRQRQIAAIITSIGYANLLNGNLSAAKNAFQQLKPTNTNYVAANDAIHKIDSAKVIKDSIALGVEVIKTFFPKYSGVGSALENLVSDFL